MTTGSRAGTRPAPPDRDAPPAFSPEHFVSGNRIAPPLPGRLERAVFGMGCFWGAERMFWSLPGVHSTAAGYAGGTTRNPSYEDVCTGLTGHAEVVLVHFDPAATGYEALLAAFWEGHDPTQGMRQGGDVGPQYRSAIYTADARQRDLAAAGAARFQAALTEKGFGAVTTEIKPLEAFYYAEDRHQQYLAKNPGGYCGLAGTGACYRPAPA